jgi:energy-coupling factor transporter ATP-binding protein EcfA2
MDLAEKGTAVIVISQDLDELLQISDKIAVLSHGHLSEPLDAAHVTLEQLGLLMGGDPPAKPTRQRAIRRSTPMQLELVKRDAPSGTMLIAAPFMALGLTVLTSGIMFAVMGFNPVAALYEYFIAPLTELWSVYELLLKAGPLSSSHWVWRSVTAPTSGTSAPRGSSPWARFSVPFPLSCFQNGPVGQRCRQC